MASSFSFSSVEVNDFCEALAAHLPSDGHHCTRAEYWKRRVEDEADASEVSSERASFVRVGD